MVKYVHTSNMHFGNKVPIVWHQFSSFLIYIIIWKVWKTNVWLHYESIEVSYPTFKLSCVVLKKDGIERSHRPDVVLREVCSLGRAVRNKPKQTERNSRRRTAPTNIWSVTPLYTLLGLNIKPKSSKPQYKERKNDWP